MEKQKYDADKLGGFARHHRSGHPHYKNVAEFYFIPASKEEDFSEIEDAILPSHQFVHSFEDVQRSRSIKHPELDSDTKYIPSSERLRLPEVPNTWEELISISTVAAQTVAQSLAYALGAGMIWPDSKSNGENETWHNLSQKMKKNGLTKK